MVKNPHFFYVSAKMLEAVQCSGWILHIIIVPRDNEYTIHITNR